MVAGDTTVYLVYSGLLAVVGLVITALAFRTEGRAKQIALVGAVPAVAMAVAYFTMHLELLTFETEGREQSVTRFFGYTLALTAFVYILDVFTNMGKRRVILLLGVILATLWLQFVTWFLAGPIESLFTATSLGLFAFAAYLMYRPINSLAREHGGKRRLFYAKIRDVFVLCYLGLILTSAASEQVLGLLTAFVSTTTAGFIDLILVTSIGFLTLTAVSIFEHATGDVSAATESGTVDSGAVSQDD